MIEPIPEALQNLYKDDSLIYQADNHFYYNKSFDRDLLKDIENHEFQIYNGTYTYNYKERTTDIYLIGRGKTCGKKIFRIEGFFPYCYVKCKEENADAKDYLGNSVERYNFYQEPKKVADYRKLMERSAQDIPYEADILFVRRMLIDVYDFFKPKDYINPSIAICDIETNFPINTNIISFAINNYDTGEIYFNSHYYSSKYELLLDLYTKIIDYDIVANWNVDFDVGTLRTKLRGLEMVLKPLEDGYELPKEDYIKHLVNNNSILRINTVTKMLDILEEFEFIKIDNIVRKGRRELDLDLDFLVTPMDLIPISKKMYGKEIKGRWSLHNTGVRLCGIDKYDIGINHPGDLDEDTLLEYNCLDVIVPEIIDNYLGGLQCHVILAWSLQSMIKDTIITAAVNDIALLRAYHKNNIVLPSRNPFKAVKDEDDEYGYKAAEPDARPGVYKDILAVDLHAAYPSAVLAINASCETKDPNGKYIAPNGIRFNENHSVFIDTLKELLAEREKVKKSLKDLEKGSSEWRKQKYIDFALKTQVAAFSHGIFGWENSRMYDVEVADAITATVRGILDTIKAKVDSMGYRWVYCHTDSVYLKVDDTVNIQELVDTLNRTIEQYCNLQGYSHIPYLDYKGFYPKAYIHSPARNVLVDENDEWTVTGMSHIRSDMPEPLADIEVELISMRLDEKPEEDIVSRIREMILNLKTTDSRDLCTIKPLTKSISRYGRIGKDGHKVGIPYHIKALLKAKDEYGMKVKIGEKFGVIPIVLDEYTGVRIIRRKKGYMAFPIDEGLPDMYNIDFREYLKSNLWGKICKLFNCKPREVEKLLIDDELREELYVENVIKKE